MSTIKAALTYVFIYLFSAFTYVFIYLFIGIKLIICLPFIIFRKFFYGPIRFAAAENALIAKHMFLSFDDKTKTMIIYKQREIFRNCRVHDEEAFINRLTEGQFFGSIAMVMDSMFIPPSLLNVLHKDQWNNINNPVTTIYGDEKEIAYAQRRIMEKHGIHINLTAKKWKDALSEEAIL